MRDDFEGAADGVAGLAGAHRSPAIICALDRRIDAVQRRIVGRQRRCSIERDGERIGDGRRRRSPMTWLTISDADVREQLARDGAGGDARGGFARAGALEHVADVVVAVLERAGQVGVARAADASPARARRRASVVRRLGLDVIVCCQFSQSCCGISSAIGPPSVSPWRTPDRISARSCSIAMRRPRP